MVTECGLGSRSRIDRPVARERGGGLWNTSGDTFERAAKRARLLLHGEVAAREFDWLDAKDLSGGVSLPCRIEELSSVV
jgi:hypothetical protein